MTNNPTIDGMSREFRELLEQVARPIMKSRDETVRRRAISKLRALLDAPAVERQEPDYYEKIGNVISDILDGRTLTAIAALRTMQAWESDPKPLMVTFSDHKKGLDAYLEQITALQSTIAQLQARIAELESGRGEPVAVKLPARDESLGTAESDMYANGWRHGWNAYEHSMRQMGPLYTAPPAPVAVVLPDFDTWYAKNVGVIGTEAYKHDHEIWHACLDATAALNGAGKK